ncbi:MAG: Kelch repeat-containing protein [Thermoleophilaceae bacterium]
MKVSRRRTGRRLPAGFLPGLVLMLFALAGLKAAGVGPDLPGPHLFSELGIASSGTGLLQYCTPKPGLILDPAKPRPAAGSWRKEPNMPVPGAEESSAVLGGRIYIVGGQDYLGRTTEHVFTFDPKTRTYARIANLPMKADHTVSVVYHGQLYVVAGYLYSNPIAWLVRYSPRTGKWTVLEKPPTPRGGAGGGVIGHKFYVAGGAPRSDPNTRVAAYHNLEIYDFRTGHWSRGPDMPTARHHVGAAVVRSTLYVAGGRRPTNQASRDFEGYDARTNRWTRLAPLPVGVSAMGLVAHGRDVILIAGGNDEGSREGGGYVSPATWAYDTVKRAWHRLPDLPRGQHASAYTIADGRIWSFSGIDCPGYHPTGDTYSLPLGSST